MEITTTNGSWKHKRELYLASKNSSNLSLRKYNKLCSKIQYNIIKESRKCNYTRITLILNSSNKNKTTSDIMKLETQVSDIEGKPFCDQRAIADAFCNYFFL
jgi:hypothetical protein